VEWFKIYKMPDGKPPNEFAFDGKPKVSKSLGFRCYGILLFRFLIFHIDLISQRIRLADHAIFQSKTIRKNSTGIIVLPCKNVELRFSRSSPSFGSSLLASLEPVTVRGVYSENYKNRVSVWYRDNGTRGCGN
jgi:hypothetical protein